MPGFVFLLSLFVFLWISCSSRADPAPHPLTRALTNTTFVAFDVETTGLSAKNGRIVEIGAVKFRNGKQLDSCSWLVNPGIPIPWAAQRVHGITDKMVSVGAKFGDIYPAFHVFIDDAVLVAHNAAFDTRFISAELARNNLAALENDVLDTLKLARVWFPDAGRHSMTNLVRFLAIPAETFHRALADARNVMAVFLKGLERLPADATLADLRECSTPNVPRPTPKARRARVGAGAQRQVVPAGDARPSDSKPRSGT